MVEMLWNVKALNVVLQTTKAKKGKGLSLGRNSPFNKIPIIGAIL